MVILYSLQLHRMHHKFVIGQPHCVLKNFECDQATLDQERQLESEADLFNDILRVNVLDSYNALSEKTCALLEWAATQSFDYFLKTDHDIFLRLDTIYAELKERGVSNSYWSGFVWRDVPPISDPSDKNREVQYEMGKFPPYTAGALHILSSDLVYGLSSSLSRRYYQNEDQSLGLWLFPFNVTPIHDPRIQQWDVCHPALIAKHPLTPQRMRDMYNNVILGDMCRGFDTLRCPLCWRCSPEQSNWRGNGLDCNENGATVIEPYGVDPPKVKKPKVEDVMDGVVGFLPYAHCTRTQLEDVPQNYNLVGNPHFNRDAKASEKGKGKNGGEGIGVWGMVGSARIVEGGMSDYIGDPRADCLELYNTADTRSSYAFQVL